MSPFLPNCSFLKCFISFLIQLGVFVIRYRYMELVECLLSTFQFSDEHWVE